jgi:hypothetical protein
VRGKRKGQVGLTAEEGEGRDCIVLYLLKVHASERGRGGKRKKEMEVLGHHYLS